MRMKPTVTYTKVFVMRMCTKVSSCSERQLTLPLSVHWSLSSLTDKPGKPNSLQGCMMPHGMQPGRSDPRAGRPPRSTAHALRAPASRGRPRTVSRTAASTRTSMGPERTMNFQ